MDGGLLLLPVLLVKKTVFLALTPSCLPTLINHQMLDLTDISKSSIGSWQQVRFAYIYWNYDVKRKLIRCSLFSFHTDLLLYFKELI